MTATPLASLSLACRVTLNLHSLNNEGGEGNQIQTRMVDIVNNEAHRHTVNAISGDMMRHVVGEKLLRVAQQRGLPLSKPARQLNANRIAADEQAMEEIAALPSDGAALDLVLRRCAISEMMGTLITADSKAKRSLPRPSVVEFGWVVGVPDQVHTDSFFHAKYQSDRGSEQARREARQQQQESTGSNLGQAIFHRPASSGVYALVCHLELARIGLNDITQRYSLSVDERTARARALVEALLFGILELQGAMRAAQLPHLTGIQGIVTTSSGVVPAPLISPLAGSTTSDQDLQDDDAYRAQAARIVGLLNGLSGSILTVHRFEDVAGFTEVLSTIARDLTPADLAPAAEV